MRSVLVEETENRLFRLRRDRQRLNRELLSGLQGDQVRALLVHVGDGQLARTAIERRRVVRREVDANVQQGDVRTEALRTRLCGRDRRIDKVVSLVEDRHARARRVREVETANGSTREHARCCVGSCHQLADECIHASDRDGRRRLVAELEAQFRDARIDQVQALVARVTDKVIELRGEGVDLGLRSMTLHSVLSLCGRQHTLDLLQDRDRSLKTLGACCQRGHALVDVRFAGGQVVCPVRERLGLKEQNSVVDRARDLKTGRKMAFRDVLALVDLLQRQQVLLCGCAEDNIRHVSNFLLEGVIRPLRSPTPYEATTVPSSLANGIGKIVGIAIPNIGE
jgi:hypothetical protein